MSKKEYGAIWYKVYIYINLRIFIFRVLVQYVVHICPLKVVVKNEKKIRIGSHTKSESSPKKNKTNKMLDKVPQMCEVFKN